MIDIKSKIMTYEEYNNAQIKIPYKFKLKTKSGKLLYYFGANHIFDYKHKQTDAIKQYWSEFLRATEDKKKLVLAESGFRNLEETEVEAVEKSGENGLITYLAHKENIDVEIPEPTRKDEIGDLLGRYTKEEIEYYYFASAVYWWAVDDGGLEFEDWAEGFLEHEKDVSIWKDFDFTLENMRKIHKKLFKGDLDPRDKDFFSSLMSPLYTNTSISKYSADSGLNRDAYIVNYIFNKLGEGFNVFVVFGLTHAVVQKPALEQLVK